MMDFVEKGRGKEVRNGYLLETAAQRSLDNVEICFIRWGRVVKFQVKLVSCVGVDMFMLRDRIECQKAIKLVLQQISIPTSHCYF